MNKIAWAFVLCLIAAVPVRAAQCPDYVNQRVNQAVNEGNAAVKSGDPKVICAAARRVISEAQTAVSVGCGEYSEVIAKLQASTNRCESEPATVDKPALEFKGIRIGATKAEVVEKKCPPSNALAHAA